MVDPNYSKETFYVLDADGNVMAINERITTVTGGPLIFAINTDFKCVEQFVYGSSRLGTIHADVGLNVLNPLLNTNANSNLFDVYYGKKDYELTNHLGNVITTVSDRKKAIDGVYSYVGYGTGNYEFDGTDFVSVTAGTGYYNQTTAPNGTVDFYVADIRTVADYYAFGQAMPGRSHAVGNIKYRYGMNGQEMEDEVFDGATSAEYWMYDARLGRRFENDPITYEHQSPYACFNNNPIYYSDPFGLEGEKGDGDDKGDGEGDDKTVKGEHKGKWKKGKNGGNEYKKPDEKEKGNPIEDNGKSNDKKGEKTEKTPERETPKQAGWEHANKGTEAHSVFTAWARVSKMPFKDWKVNLSINGQNNLLRPDLVYDNGIIGGVWELKPADPSKSSYLAVIEAKAYAVELNLENQTTRFQPGSSGGAPMALLGPLFLPGKNGNGFLYTMPRKDDGAIYWVEIKKEDVHKYSPNLSVQTSEETQNMPNNYVQAPMSVPTNGIYIKPDTGKKVFTGVVLGGILTFLAYLGLVLIL